MLQSTSVLSTTEAEAAKEVIWLKGLTSNLGLQERSVLKFNELANVQFVSRRTRYFMEGQMKSCYH